MTTRRRWGYATVTVGLVAALFLLGWFEIVPRPDFVASHPIPPLPGPTNETTVQTLNWTIFHSQGYSDCPFNTSVQGPGFSAVKGGNITITGPDLGYCWNSVSKVQLDPAGSADFELTSFARYVHATAYYVVTVIVLSSNVTLPNLGIWMTSPMDANGHPISAIGNSET